MMECGELHGKRDEVGVEGESNINDEAGQAIMDQFSGFPNSILRRSQLAHSIIIPSGA